MAKVRYVGSSTWSRVITDDEGKFKKQESVKPGEVVELDDDIAEHFTNSQVPRHMRVFVLENGPEDKLNSNYVPSRYEAIADANNASPYPELDMGSTRPPNVSISNPEGLTQEDIDKRNGPTQQTQGRPPVRQQTPSKKA